MPTIVAAEAVADLVEAGVITAGSMAATAVTVAVDLAVSVTASLGIGLIEQAIMGQPNQKPPHAKRDNIRQAVAPRIKYYGRVKIGGTYAFLKVGLEPGGNTGVLFQVIVFGEGPFDLYEEMWFGSGKAVFNEGDHGAVLVPKSYHYKGGDYVELTYRLGTDSQNANEVLTQDFPGQWTSDFRGRGVAYAVVLLVSPDAENFNNVYPEGLPTLSTVARTAKVFDPRDSNQTLGGENTWRWSSNPVLCWLDALRSPDGLGIPGEMFWGAMDVWSDAASYCDVIFRTKNGGSEKRFRLAGGYQLTDPPKNWLPKMLDVADGRIHLRGDGVIVPSVGRWQEPELTITDDQIYAYTNFSKGRAKPDIRNQINASFTAPDYNYIEQQADPILNEDSIDVDGFQPMTLDLNMCPSHSQARRRMKIEAARQDPEGWSGTIVTNVYGLKFLNANSDGSPRRFVRFQIAELGLNSTFEVGKFTFDWKTGRCTFTVQEMTADAFDWDYEADEGTAPITGLDNSNSGVENPYNLQVSVSGAVLTATLDTPLSPNLTLLLDYRLTNDAIGDDYEAVWHNLTISGWGGHTGNLPNGRYDIRARYHNNADQPDYSDPLIIRGVIVRVAGGVYDPGAVTDELGNPITTGTGDTITTET